LSSDELNVGPVALEPRPPLGSRQDLPDGFRPATAVGLSDDSITILGVSKRLPGSGKLASERSRAMMQAEPGDGDGLRGSPMNAPKQGVLGCIMAWQRPDTPSAERRECLLISRSAIDSSERPTAVVGRRPSGKSRLSLPFCGSPTRKTPESPRPDGSGLFPQVTASTRPPGGPRSCVFVRLSEEGLG